jgi:ferredoxin-NADP reductase
MSMLRHAVATEPARPVTLVYCARTEADFAFGDELASLVKRHPQLRVQLAASSGIAPPHVYPGRIDESLLRATAPDLAHAIAFVCGPLQMIEDMKTLLARLGVPGGQIRHEVFQAAIAASAGVTREEPQTVAAPAGARSRLPHRDTGAAHRLTCSKSQQQVAIRAGQTLLEAAEEGGVAIDSLCRAGVCGTCRVQVSEGDVTCESDTLDAEEQSQGFVLACVTTTRSDCTVDL